MEQEKQNIKNNMKKTISSLSQEEEEANVNNKYYTSHWNEIYKSNNNNNNNNDNKIEWHITYDKCKQAIDPYIRAVSEHVNEKENLLVVDIGCGNSDIGVNILNDYNLSKLLLTDFSFEIINEITQTYKNDSRIEAIEADCRNMEFVNNNAAYILLDKGTFDALVGENDKYAMLKECKRMLHPKGFFISISFPSVQRIKFFEKYCPELGLACRLKIIADGDPADGYQSVFVFILGVQNENCTTTTTSSTMNYKFNYKPMINDPVDELTTLCLNRIEYSGSLYTNKAEEDAKEDGKLMQNLFDDSEEDDE